MTEENLSPKRRGKLGRIFLTVLVSMSITAAIVTILVINFFPVFQIHGNSMASTLFDGDIVVTRKTNTLKKGDICMFSMNGTILCKRVVAVGGDEINIDRSGSVFVNGKLLNEPYLNGSSLGNSTVEYPVNVPKNSYFVIGDNRRTSIDSRNSSIGCISSSQIEGKVLFRILPIPGIPK